MAVQIMNVYRSTVVLNSLIDGGYGMAGIEVAVIAESPDAVMPILQAQYGSDIASVRGPVLVVEGALTTMTGSLRKAPAAPAPPPADEEESEHHPAKHAAKKN
jgi:hypothetical protein